MRSDTLLRWRQIQRSQDPVGLRVALLASFTVDTLVPGLGVALADRGVRAAIIAGPFNQIVQECADPASGTSRFGPDVLVIWPRLEDLWGNLPAPLDQAGAHDYADPLQEVAFMAENGARRMGALLVLVLPVIPVERVLGAGDAGNPAGAYATATRAREKLRERFAGRPGVVVYDAEETARRIGTTAASDRRFGSIAGMPYSAAMLDAAGEGLARAIILATRPARKVIVIDADNTLWGGAVGEAGPDGVDLGPGPAAAFLDFQSHLLDLRRAGVLLALCSKNTEQDVWAAFGRREMRLRREHLSAWRIGWDTKPDTVREIAAELGVGTDAVVFVDDNPAETAAVRAELPEVATVLMPADPTGWYEALDAGGVLDRLPPTADDRQRPERVDSERSRRVFAQTVPPEVYLKELGIWAGARDASPADLGRLSQLVLKTNQLNMNGLRLTEQQLRELSRSSSHRVRMVDAGDRFGDYGTVGAYVLDRRAYGARLRLFLLSCRALGRGVEQFMIADAFAAAAIWGPGRLMAVVVPTDRNEPAQRLFAGLRDDDGPALADAADGAVALRRIEAPPYLTTGK